MPISLNQEGGPGYKINSLSSAAPIFLLSGATYSARHLSLAFTDKAHWISHIALAAIEWIPVVGGLAALVDWRLNKKVTSTQALSPLPVPTKSLLTPSNLSSRRLNYEIKTLKLEPLDQLYELKFIDVLEELADRNDRDNLSFSLEEIETFISNYIDARKPSFSEEDQKNIALVKSRFLPKAEIEQIFHNLSIEESKKTNTIVQEPITVENFKDLHYPQGYLDSSKYRDRMDAIATYFDKDDIVLVRGNGDCFFNCLIPGLLLTANLDLLLQKVKELNNSSHPYVGSNSALSFSKENDLESVTSFLSAPLPYKLNEDFNEKFSRVLRYMCVVQNESRNQATKLDDKEIPKEIGSEEAHADVEAIGLVNEIFGTEAYCAVLSYNPIFTTDQTSHKANEVFITKGKRAYENTDCSILSDDSRAADFILILDKGHYSCLV